jgi:hypothetical protein
MVYEILIKQAAEGSQGLPVNIFNRPSIFSARNFITLRNEI